MELRIKKWKVIWHMESEKTVRMDFIYTKTKKTAMKQLRLKHGIDARVISVDEEIEEEEEE